MALEAEFWAALVRLATARSQSLSALVSEADAARDPGRPLASALRVLALRELPLLGAADAQIQQDGTNRNRNVTRTGKH